MKETILCKFTQEYHNCITLRLKILVGSHNCLNSHGSKRRVTSHEGDSSERLSDRFYVDKSVQNTRSKKYLKQILSVVQQVYSLLLLNFLGLWPIFNLNRSVWPVGQLFTTLELFSLIIKIKTSEDSSGTCSVVHYCSKAFRLRSQL